MIQAIIFDFDGTLAETEYIHIQSLKEAFEEETGLTINKDEIGEKGGMMYYDKLTIIFRDHGITDFDKMKIADMAYEKYKKVFLDKVGPRVGVINVVKKLAGNYKIGVCSPNEKSVLEDTLKKFNIREFFDVIVSIEDVERPKPDPEGYVLAAKRLGVKPEECLVFEDTPTGFTSAKSAGMKVIALHNPYLKDPEYPGMEMFLKSFEDFDINSINNF